MKRILITEHQDTTKRMLQHAFEALDESFEVTYVSSADDCLRYLEKSENYDLCFILLDPAVPGVVENNLLSKLSQEEAFITIPVIVFSDQSNEAQVVNCYNSGANAFVRKPSDRETFQKTIASITDFWSNVNVLAKPEALVEF